MASLLIGPMLRYVSDGEATIWLEADAGCTVEVLGCRTETFQVNGRHYAIVAITGLTAGSCVEYEVLLDGVRCWPEPDSALPPSRIRTLPQSGPVELVFGSCRVTRPHHAPYTLSPDDHELGVGVDALNALAVRMQGQEAESWPDMLLLLGDQVYGDEVSPQTAEFIRANRDVSKPPGLEVADFEEYARLHREAWSRPDAALAVRQGVQPARTDPSRTNPWRGLRSGSSSAASCRDVSGSAPRVARTAPAA